MWPSNEFHNHIGCLYFFGLVVCSWWKSSLTLPVQARLLFWLSFATDHLEFGLQHETQEILLKHWQYRHIWPRSHFRVLHTLFNTELPSYWVWQPRDGQQVSEPTRRGGRPKENRDWNYAIATFYFSTLLVWCSGCRFNRQLRGAT